MLTEHGQCIADLEHWRGRAVAAEDELAAHPPLRREIYGDVLAIKRAVNRTSGMIEAVEQRFDALLRKLAGGITD
jgi:hypothetical protein